MNRYVDPKRLNERIRKTQSREFVSYWRSIQEVIHKMAKFPASIPEVQSMLRISSAARFTSTVIFTATFTLVFLSFVRAASWFTLSALGAVSAIALAIAISASILSIFFERRTWARIQDHFKRNPTKFAKERAYMRQTAQELIDHIRERLKTDKEDPSTHIFELQSLGYRGVMVIKQPSFFRKTYKVIPEP